MKQEQDPLQALTEIRSIMERSTKFLSLSGLSGIFAGTVALIGAGIAYCFVTDVSKSYEIGTDEIFTFFFQLALGVLALALVGGYYFTFRKAKHNNQQVWDASSKRLLINLLIPLTAGGMFCLVLLIKGFAVLVAPATLVFYGLALVSASKYTLDDIKYLGFCQIVLGLLALMLLSMISSILIWAIGFGVLYIVYGCIMYNKYDR
jgi:hypothetical protein